ncbi:CDP-glucose 4,6-dehydratase [Brevundimonas subvibrioides]|uniref:CDP-glucose 4,6-dehydratase n=1 Tax=Brevundimonas subvibrioides TaxID=74313 RepID=UPI0032D59564
MSEAERQAFWRGKRVFLTGHTGFKGTWLAFVLHRWGALVHGFALSPEGDANLFKAAERHGVFASSVIGDIRNPRAVDEALSASDPEIVFHLAAQPLVRLSYRDPVATYATNVMGTVHVLDAIRRLGSVKAVVAVTSDKCYENNEWFWGYRENEPMGGYDPYSNSKGCSELVVSAFRKSYFKTAGVCGLGSGRAGNVIGGGDWSEDRLVPDLIRNILAGDETPIRNPVAVRPWQHVLEPLSGYLSLAEELYREPSGDAADGWNFGPDASSERSVLDVVSGVCSAWGDGASWRRDEGEHVHEAGYLKLDSSKARRILKWEPVWGFDRTIEMTVSWYKAEAAREDLVAFTTAQISQYFADLAAQKEKN